MRKIIIAVACCVMSTGAYAQGPQASPTKYAPIDEDLWRTMVQSISEVPMGYSSHQEIFRLLNSVQLEAQKRAAAKEAAAVKEAKPATPPATPAAPTPARSRRA